MNLAFVQFNGMSSGGGEKYLQTYATILAKSGCVVDYYYTGNANYSDRAGVDFRRKQFVESFGIRTIPITIDEYDRNCWKNTNFFERFDENNYSVVHSAIGGHSEYPFNVLNTVKIVHTVHGIAANDQKNIFMNVLLCKWQADRWLANGGNKTKLEIIPSVVYTPEKTKESFRQELGIPEDAFVCGFHQRSESGLFSSIPFDAFASLSGAYFVLMGGSERHREYAKQQNLKNVFFLDHNSDTTIIHKFLQTLDCYSHSKSCGEVCSACIIEAMYHGLPVITHPGVDMGHLEMVENCGKMTYNLNEYTTELRLLKDNKAYRQHKSGLTQEKYDKTYAYSIIESKILDIYKTIGK